MLARCFGLLSVLAPLVLWPAAALGQSSALMDAYNRSLELYAQGRYEEALPFAKKALKLGEEKFGLIHATTVTQLNNLAALLYAQGKYAEAESLYKRELAIYEKALGPKHPNVAATLNNLAAQYRAQGKYAEAEPLYKRAVAIYEI